MPVVLIENEWIHRMERSKAQKTQKTPFLSQDFILVKDKNRELNFYVVT